MHKPVITHHQKMKIMDITTCKGKNTEVNNKNIIVKFPKWGKQRDIKATQ